jgi:hypothetical protein
MSPLSPREIQLVQLFGAIAVAVYVGLRFIPARHRRRVGLVLTFTYVAAVVAFATYVLLR